MAREHFMGIVLMLAAAAVGTLLAILFGPFVEFRSSANDLFTAVGEGKNVRPAAPQFLPPGIQDAPEPLRDWVLQGHRLMTDTGKYAGKYIGADLTCSHCHFHGGLTEGGRNGGLSLVGVAAQYPRYVVEQREMDDLAARINACFERSMNGKRLPLDSKEMAAMMAYLQWISKGIPIYAKIDWLRPGELKNEHRPNSAVGEQAYITRCAVCHGSQGQGTRIGPPVWGPRSFNTGAGFHRIGKLAAFVHLNMPHDNPMLSADEALDVSAYVLAQPRPEFAAK